METTTEIKLQSIRASDNYRKTMDKAGMKELTESVKSRGVLQPILVRKNGRGFFIIAGHRRHQAAINAGLKTIPAIVKDVGEEEALELSVIENTQREDPNPMEEAVGFNRLIAAGKHSPQSLAAKLDKSVKYVLGRLKLVKLPKETQKAVLDGKLPFGHALLLTRLKNHGDIKELTKEALEEGFTERDVRREINYKSTLLREAEFNTDSCVRCSARSTNQSILFPEDAKRDDSCMDKSCFFIKTRNHYQAMVKELKAKGVRVVTAEKEYNELLRNPETGRPFASVTEISPKRGEWRHPKKYKSMCVPCENRVFVCLEKKGYHGDIDMRVEEICTEKKCFDKMNGREEPKSQRYTRDDDHRPNKGLDHARAMRDRFLKHWLPGKVFMSPVLQKRLALYHILLQFDRLKGEATETRLKIFKELFPEINWTFIGFNLMSSYELYVGIAQVPEDKLDELLNTVLLRSIQHTDTEALLHMTPEAGIDMKRDFVMDEEYLKTKTKAELVPLAKAAAGIDLAPSLKKTAMLEELLKNDLTGKTTDEIDEECKVHTLGEVIEDSAGFMDDSICMACDQDPCTCEENDE